MQTPINFNRLIKTRLLPIAESYEIMSHNSNSVLVFDNHGFLRMIHLEPPSQSQPFGILDIYDIPLKKINSACFIGDRFFTLQGNQPFNIYSWKKLDRSFYYTNMFSLPEKYVHILSVAGKFVCISGNPNQNSSITYADFNDVYNLRYIVRELRYETSETVHVQEFCGHILFINMSTICLQSLESSKFKMFETKCIMFKIIARGELLVIEHLGGITICKLDVREIDDAELTVIHKLDDIDCKLLALADYIYVHRETTLLIYDWTLSLLKTADIGSAPKYTIATNNKLYLFRNNMHGYMFVRTLREFYAVCTRDQRQQIRYLLFVLKCCGIPNPIAIAIIEAAII